MLHDRDEQLAAVAGLVERARRGRGASVQVTGPVGSGRSSLLAAAGAAAEGAGATVLRARGTPLESGFAFGVARRLTEPLTDEIPGVPGAGLAVDTESPDPAVAEDLHRTFEALTGGLRGAVTGTGAPALLVVDDHQWCDVASYQWLAYLGRRLDRLGVVVLTAVLDGDGSAGARRTASAPADVVTLRLPPLRVASVEAMVAACFGQAGEPGFVAALLDSARGVPLITEAVIEDLASGDVEPLDQRADDVAAARPKDLRERLVGTLRAQPVPVRRLLAALAVLGEAVEPDLSGRLARLDEQARSRALDACCALGLVVTDPWPRLLPHTVDAITATLSGGERRELDLRAAALLRDAGHGAERVAGHLMAVPALEAAWALGVLRAAAAGAEQRGDLGAAVAPLRHALLCLTPDDPRRGELLIELATVERSLDTGVALRRIAQAVPQLREGVARAVARIPVFSLLDLSTPLVSVLRRVAAQLADARDVHAGDPRGELARELEARVRYLDLDGPAGLRHAVARYRTMSNLPVATRGDRDLSTVLVYAAALAGDLDAAGLARAVSTILAAEPASADQVLRPVALLVDCGCMADAPGELLPWLEIALEQACLRGARALEAVLRAQLGTVLLCSGRRAESEVQILRSAELLADDVAEGSRLPGMVLGPAAATLSQSSLLERLVEGHLADGRRSPLFGTVMQLLRARTAEIDGDLPTALEYCLDGGRRLEELGLRGAVPFPWRSLAIDLLRRLGQQHRAHALALAERDEADRWGAPRFVGRSLRLLASLVPPDEAGPLLARSAEVLRGSHDRHELVRALRDLAEHAHRAGSPTAGQAEREAARIEAELDGAPACPAPLPAPRAAGPVMIGLTRGEHRVASMAAGGVSNQEIADRLDVSVRAVEKHLTAAYRKLGVPGRGALSELWSDHAAGGEDLTGQRT